MSNQNLSKDKKKNKLQKFTFFSSHTNQQMKPPEKKRKIWNLKTENKRNEINKSNLTL